MLVELSKEEIKEIISGLGCSYSEHCLTGDEARQYELYINKLEDKLSGILKELEERYKGDEGLYKAYHTCPLCKAQTNRYIEGD